MFGAFQTFGKLGAIGKAIAAAWSPLALWPDGVDSPGMWIDPSLLTASFNDYTGTTPVATPGSVADSANPVGLALDIRAGATALADPGNHMLQATSAARPLLSGRVNLLISTEDLTNASAWPRSGGAATPNASTVTFGATGEYIYQTATGVTANMPTTSRLLLSGSGTITINFFDAGGAAETQITLTGTPTWYTLTRTASGAAVDLSIQIVKRAGDTAASVTCGGIQMNLGSVPLPYQRVGAASDYDATGITPFQLYDGIDDSMATASFAAGTLINGMDCMIAVRRDSAANCVAGLYNGIADATKFFGMAESGSGSRCVGSGAGTPTVWVDNIQLTGGTAVTRGTLHTALTAGNVHILEFQDLDLSAWTATGFGLYTSYVFPGARGDIMLYPSTAITEDKDAARQYLADKYGVKLA